MRIAIGIEYDGTAYNGWQRQQNGCGIQERVEQALSIVADETVTTTCAGRTDAGVHAAGQVVHFDTNTERADRSWLLGANSNLPNDINANWVRRVDDEFHARFSATARSYRYLILNRPVRSSLGRRRAWWVNQPLNERRMHDAAQLLVGKHDFSAFRAAGCQASTPVREVRLISVGRDGDRVVLGITANAFLQRMVRNITGTLAAIGSGERPVEWLAELLESRNRKRGGVAAPPTGLTLLRVDYPRKYDLPVCPGTNGKPGQRSVAWSINDGYDW
jgi:tRNA pseudouridine38-40 synthase